MSGGGRLREALFGRLPPSGALRPPLKGTVSRVIRVRDPAPGVFREAIFLLDDSYLTRGGVDREALLQQAREAALSYSADHRAPRCPSPAVLLGSHALCLLLGGLLAFLLF